MRDGWVETTLGEIGKWNAGGTPKATNPDFYGGDIPFVTIADLADAPLYETQRYLTAQGLEQIGHTAPVGAIFVSMYGTVGRTGIAKSPMATNQAIAWLESDENVVDNLFAFWVLRSLATRLDELARGATQRNVNRDIIWSAAVFSDSGCDGFFYAAASGCW